MNKQPPLLTLFDNRSYNNYRGTEKVPHNDFGSKFDEPSSDCSIKTIDSSEKIEASLYANKPKHKFTVDEDQKLKQLIDMFGPRKWNQIAMSLPGRTGRQCRDRYQNYLSPSLINGPWSIEEDQLLKQKVLEIGQHWNKIAKFFNGRSSNNVKNRWYTYLSKKSKGLLKGQKDNNVYKFENNNYFYNFSFNQQNINRKSNNINSIKNENKDIIIPKKSENLKKVLFPPIYPPNDFMILHSNDGLFNFLRKDF